MSLGALLIVSLAAAVYFVPAMIAAARKSKRSGGIMTLNVLLGWTVLGWIGALVWACTDAVEKPVA